MDKRKKLLKMKQIILPPLLAACLALPAAALAQTCASPNATSDYIVGEAEGRPSAMHWHSGLVWSRCIEGMTFNGSQCSGGALADIQKHWLEWISTQELLPLPFDQQADWGISASLTEDRLRTGTWRLPYRLEYRAVMSGCPDDGSGKPVNQEVLPTIYGQGGIHGWHWSASPKPGDVNSAWVTYFNLSTGGSWLSNFATEARVVRGGQPFANLPAGPFADTRPAGTPSEFTLPAPLASQSGTGAAWGGARIGGNGLIRINGTGNWVREAIVKSGDQISVRMLAPATEGQQAAATLTLRSGQTTGTAANAANGGAEDTVVSETSTTFTVTASASAAPRACRVTPTGTGDGTSWPQAASLADALADFSCSEVWLQRTNSGGGPVYVPPSARGFAIERNVKLYGGFVGTEATRAERPDPVSPTQTTLDGNNHSRVLYLDGSLGTPLNDTLIDGVYLVMGLAAGPGANGGALYCNGAGAGSVCSPQLNRVYIGASGADGHGGALFNDASRGGVSSPVLTNVIIRNSNAGGDGGAIYNLGDGGTSSPVLRNVYFENTHASGGSGGAVYNLARGSSGISSPVIEQASFNGNDAAEYGGAIYSETRDGGTSRMEVRNTTFATNQSASGQPGGAIAIVGVGGDASVDVEHATFVNNMSGAMNNALFTQGGDVRVINSVLWGNPATAQRAQAITYFTGSTTITDSMIQDGCAAGNQAVVGGSATCPGVTLAADPELGALDANGMDGYPVLYGYLPGPNSQLLDAVACTVPTDQRGIARPQGAGCDIGALERRGTVALAVTLSGSGTGTVSGAPSACATGTCSYDYPGEGSAQTVTLTAAPAVGHSFSGWSGACSGTGTCSVTMNQARTVGAAFVGPATYTVGGTTSGLTGTGLLLRNGGEDLPVAANGAFTFTGTVADGGSYAVTIAAQPTGQRCTIANASGSNVSASVSNVQVACVPYFEGTTVPASGAGGTGRATFTGGGPACRFDLGATGFEAAPATPPPGRTLPQGLLRVRLVNCTAAVAMEITWPEPVAGYTKYGLADRTDTLPSYFAPTGLAISGRTVRFTLTDDQQGDDDWTPNGTIADPSGPTALAAAPGGAQAIPTLSEGGLLLLTALLALLALRRRVV